MILWSSLKVTLAAANFSSSIREWMNELLKVFRLQMTADGKYTWGQCYKTFPVRNLRIFVKS
jgi:hypothetical protein